MGGAAGGWRWGAEVEIESLGIEGNIEIESALLQCDNQLFRIRQGVENTVY